MRIAYRKNACYIAMLLLLVALSACSPRPEFEVYEGPTLLIAVVGEVPNVKEEQVNFYEVSFDDLEKSEIQSYDAVIITEENLVEASENQYWDVYMNSPIPFFFMSVISDSPFIVKDEAYDEEWSWKKGHSYAAGVLVSQEDGFPKSWRYGLYNDEKTEEHIQEVYSRIFKTINELEQ